MGYAVRSVFAQANQRNVKGSLLVSSGVNTPMPLITTFVIIVRTRWRVLRTVRKRVASEGQL